MITKLNEDTFRMQIGRLEGLYGKIDPAMALREYYPIVKGLSPQRFAEIVEHIKNNWDSPKNFPTPAFFVKAKQITAPLYPEEKPITRKDDNSATNTQWQEFCKRWKKAADLMDYFKIQECGDLENARYNMQPFYRDKVSRGLLWSVENKKWVHKKNALGSGYYWNPAEWGMGL